ncbi:hypothetical protein ACRALDRAFT_1083482 [Sodiomyces alcalophilus JCM 7366]|uniref:uncharacterized protein n=1 Tax=Sodiomyces alcalophilus JCM 7366 TaxID=591952 RepID=UPI0039B43B85
MASQPGYLGVANATARRSRLEALITLFTIMLALAILIFVVVFAVFGLRDGDGDGTWIPVAVAVGTTLTIVVTAILLFFLKWWECVRPRYPSMPGNRRHGYRMDIESLSGYGDFRALDTPTKIGVVMNAIGRWIDGLAMALFPCRGRDRPSARGAQNQQGVYTGYEMSRGEQPRKVSASSSQGIVAGNRNRDGHGESGSRLPSFARQKFNSFDNLVNKKGILRDGERQGRQASASSQAAGSVSSHRPSATQGLDDSSRNDDSVQERPRVSSIGMAPPVDHNNTIQHPPPAHRQGEFNRESAQWEFTPNELFVASSRTSYEPVSPRGRYGSMHSDASQISSRSTYQPHATQVPSSLRSSMSSVRLDSGSGRASHPRMTHASLAAPQRHHRLAIPDVGHDLPPRGVSGISTLPSQRGHHNPGDTRLHGSSSTGTTARLLPAPDLRRYSTEQTESLRNEGTVRPTRLSRQTETDILEEIEQYERGIRERSRQDVFQDMNRRRWS